MTTPLESVEPPATPEAMPAYVISRVLDGKDRTSCVQQVQLKPYERVISKIYSLTLKQHGDVSNFQEQIQHCIDLDGDSYTYPVSITGNKILCAAKLKTDRSVEYSLHVIGKGGNKTYAGAITTGKIQFFLAFEEGHVKVFITEHDPVKIFTLKQEECSFEHEGVKIFFPEGAYTGGEKDIKIRIHDFDIEEMITRQRHANEYVFNSISNLVFIGYHEQLNKPVQLQMLMKKMPTSSNPEVNHLIAFCFDGKSYHVMENVSAEEVDINVCKIDVHHFSGILLATSPFTNEEWQNQMDANYHLGGESTWRILTFVSKGGVPNTLTLRVEVVRDYAVNRRVAQRSEEGLVEPINTRSSCITLDSKCKLYVNLGRNSALKFCQNVPKKVLINCLTNAPENYTTFPVEKTQLQGKPVHAVVEVSSETTRLHTAFFYADPFFRGKPGKTLDRSFNKRTDESITTRENTKMELDKADEYIKTRERTKTELDKGREHLKTRQSTNTELDGREHVQTRQSTNTQLNGILSIRSLGILASHIPNTEAAMFSSQLNIPHGTFQEMKASVPQNHLTEVNIKILDHWLKCLVKDREKAKSELIIALKMINQNNLAESVQRAIDGERELNADDFHLSI